MSSRRSALGSWLASPPPSAALEVTAARVTGVTLAATAGGGAVVSAHAVEPLAPGVVTPALNAPNVHDEAALAGAIRSVLATLGLRSRRIGLVLPDLVAKVSLVRFEKVPAKAEDLDQLIRWQVRKSAPFRIEDAQVASEPGLAPPGGGREYVVTVARRDIIRAYERACEAAGAHAGLVDLASFNQINVVLAGGAVAGDWLLVNVAADYATLALVRDGVVIFFRNRTTAEEGELTDLVHQTAMYHEDRLGGGGITRIVLAGASVVEPAEYDRLRRAIAERIGGVVVPLDVRPGAEVRDRMSPSPDLLDMLAPAAGILLRERAGAPAARVP